MRLGLRDAAAVRGRGRPSCSPRPVPTTATVELLVAPMVRGNRELIAGLVRDPQFGPCVMLGVGGVLAEAVGDVVFRLVPLTELDAEDLIDDLATQTLLGPFRGEPAVDRERAGRRAGRPVRLATAAPDVAAVDVNPLIVVDGVPVAVDALVELGPRRAVRSDARPDATSSSARCSSPAA